MKKTAEETVRDFLFKGKPKRKYCNDYDVKDLENLLKSFAQQAIEEQGEKIETWGMEIFK